MAANRERNTRHDTIRTADQLRMTGQNGRAERSIALCALYLPHDRARDRSAKGLNGGMEREREKNAERSLCLGVVDDSSYLWFGRLKIDDLGRTLGNPTGRMSMKLAIGYK